MFSPATLSQPRVAVGPRAHLWALLGYFALALVVTYPTILHFTTQVPGDLIADRDQNLWNLWWVREAITRPTNPFHTDMLYYPYGVGLYYHTLALPLGLIALVPQLLLGLAAAYNTVLLVAFTLSAYGAFRLGLLLTDGAEGAAAFNVGLRAFAAFLGGVVFAFAPYTLDALKGQPEVLSLQWMPLYAEAWIRAWDGGKVRQGVLAGVFIALCALSSLYYAVYLAIFSVVYAAYRLARGWRGSGGTISRRSLLSALVLTPAVALLLALPLAIGLVRYHRDPRIEVEASQQHKLAHSADLLSFFAPPHDHPLLGAAASGTPGVDEPALHDYVTLGYFALALAVLGAVVAWRRRGVRFWVVLGLASLVLAMGPQLQVGRALTGVPLPFAAIQWVPGVDAIAKPERFVVLARLCMGVLASWGAWWALSRVASWVGTVRWRGALSFAAALALLLVELPIHPRYEQPFSTPQGYATLASLEPGGLMELPFATQQNEVAGERMLYQTTHGHPIMAGYLARSYTSPIIDPCSPFWSFISARYVPTEGHDIVSPTISSRALDVLNFYGIRYLTIYNNYAGPASDPLDPDEKAAYEDIAARVSHTPPISQDGYVTLYRVDSQSTAQMEPAMIVGDGWYDPEGDVPFRWLKGDSGRLCVFAPRPMKAALTMDGTTFGKDMPIRIIANNAPIFTGPLSAAGTHIATTPVDWPAGMSEVKIEPDGPPTTPHSLDPNNKDNRPLTVGLRNVRLEQQPPK